MFVDIWLIYFPFNIIIVNNNPHLLSIMPNEKETIINQLMEQFPNLIINEQYTGHVLNIDNEIVYVRISTANEEEYECEIDTKHFPSENLADGVIFLLILGEINKQEFTHINYFYWSQEDIDNIEKEAKKLSLSDDLF